MEFKCAYACEARQLTRAEAARLLDVNERSFRRYIDRYEDDGIDGLIDKRMAQVSAGRAPVDEVLRFDALYRECCDGWTTSSVDDPS